MHASDSILIVDDNPNNLQVLASILHTEGFKVRPALSGELALRTLDSELPDLILLDVRMPDMDGYETCRRIKARTDSHDIPVLFISALYEIEDKLNAFRAGAVDYITKPFQAEEVLARVRTQMELARTRKALLATNAQLLALMEQLVQSEKLKSLGVLAAGVAHELNTPIGNALLVADVMEQVTAEFVAAPASGAAQPGVDALVSTFREGAPFILRNLKRAAKLIQSLKEVTVDRASERRRSVNVQRLVNDVVAVMNVHISKTPYHIAVDIAPDLDLETYPGHLEQILENLIQNAILHGFDGAATGTIQIAAQPAPEGGLRLLVEDDGKGIAPDLIKKVFDPFFTTKLGQGGSGLGLHIAYTLATGILGGSISVASTPGAGTQFTLTLPLVAPLPMEPPPQQ